VAGAPLMARPHFERCKANGYFRLLESDSERLLESKSKKPFYLVVC
jgi:hypothetical protein